MIRRLCDVEQALLNPDICARSGDEALSICGECDFRHPDRAQQSALRARGAVTPGWTCDQKSVFGCPGKLENILMAQSSTILALCMMGLLAVVNAAAFVLFRLDKHLASEGMRRIPESTLLLVALIGGSAGAIAGQQYWQHKTRKEPFRTMLFGIAIIHVMLLAWLILR
jgi:uncharacterized membrane protein YsdA (DUF1294 family)